VRADIYAELSRVEREREGEKDKGKRGIEGDK
jgi:hypothetical protein